MKEQNGKWNWQKSIKLPSGEVGYLILSSPQNVKEIVGDINQTF